MCQRGGAMAGASLDVYQYVTGRNSFSGMPRRVIACPGGFLSATRKARLFFSFEVIAAFASARLFAHLSSHTVCRHVRFTAADFTPFTRRHGLLESIIFCLYMFVVTTVMFVIIRMPFDFHSSSSTVSTCHCFSSIFFFTAGRPHGLVASAELFQFVTGVSFADFNVCPPRSCLRRLPSPPPAHGFCVTLTRPA